MRRPRRLKLVGGIRLAPGVDSIGIPVLSSPGSNNLYVPEMDEDFNIVRFLIFYNEDGYDLTYEVPAGSRDKVFSTGAPAPIYFWHKGRSEIVEGDASGEIVAAMFGADAAQSPVLQDLGRLLDDARSGVFKRRRARWLVEDLGSRFREVFYEPPVRSKYWVSRYRAAVAAARKVTQPPHPVDVRLRRIGRDWMKRFATKSDIPRIKAVLGKPQEGIFLGRESAAIMFSVLASKVANRAFTEIAPEVNAEWFRQTFPHGLHGYDIDNPRRHIPFEFDLPDFTEVLVQAVVDGRASLDFTRAENLSMLLFGSMRAPSRVFEFAQPMMLDMQDALNREVDAYHDYSSVRSATRHDPEGAKRILDIYRRMMKLDGVLHADARLSRIIVNGRFGMATRFINEIEKVVKEFDR